MELYGVCILVLCVWSATAYTNISPFDTGGCFARINSRKKCEGFLYRNISVAECCSRGAGFYTKQNISYVDIFRYMINPKSSSGGVDCYSCKGWLSTLKPDSVTCKDKTCTHGKVCMKIKNKVQCVCPSTVCQTPSNTTHKVCSNFNRTYLSECDMKKQACLNGREEGVMYNGTCQESCNNVHCNDNKQCIQDQSNRLYCVHCVDIPCNEPNSTLCGLNNVTYHSNCDLRKATCKLGKTIGIAYAGKCREVANCSTIRCTAGQQCIMNVKTPLCIDCSTGCKRSASKPIHYYGGEVCGSNDKTFPSFCALKTYICSNNVAVDVVNYGKCLVDTIACKDKKCAHGKVCMKINNEVQCECPSTVCPTPAQDESPVCSNFNETYLSECHMKQRGCLEGREEWVMYNGTCQGQELSPLSVQSFKELRTKTLTVLQLIQLANKMGIPLTLRRDNRSSSDVKTLVSVNSLLHSIYKTVTKSKV